MRAEVPLMTVIQKCNVTTLGSAFTIYERWLCCKGWECSAQGFKLSRTGLSIDRFSPNDTFIDRSASGLPSFPNTYSHIHTSRDHSAYPQTKIALLAQVNLKDANVALKCESQKPP